MKARIQLTWLKTLSTVLVAVSPLLASGCIAQTSTSGTDDPGSTAEDLTSSGDVAAAARPGQGTVPGGEQAPKLSGQFTTSTVIAGQKLDQRSAPTNDPRGAVEDVGDGKEPGPHPWRDSAQRVQR